MSPDRLSVPSPVPQLLTPVHTPLHIKTTTGSLSYKDFYADSGVLQDILTEAQNWIETNGVNVLSINTVPMIGSTSCEDPLFVNSLDKCVYDASLRDVAGGDISVPVIQVIRVMYYG